MQLLCYDDWRKLQSKLRTLLEPIENDLVLSSEWWDLVEKVFRELLATYQGRPDKEWWSHIISYQKRFGSGARGYRGWITDFLEDLTDIDEMTAGLVSVPLILEDPVRCVKDNSTLVPGMPPKSCPYSHSKAGLFCFLRTRYFAIQLHETD